MVTAWTVGDQRYWFWSQYWIPGWCSLVCRWLHLSAPWFPCEKMGVEVEMRVVARIKEFYNYVSYQLHKVLQTVLAHTKYSVSTGHSLCKVQTHIITKLPYGKSSPPPGELKVLVCPEPCPVFWILIGIVHFKKNNLMNFLIWNHF